MGATTIEGENAFAPTLLSALGNFHVIDSQNTRDQITSDRLGPNASDQIEFCAFHSFLVDNAGYIHATHA